MNMTDEELLREWEQLMPSQLEKLKSMPEEVLTLSDPLIIKAAWGPRIVTSRTRGMELSPYPEEITAHKSLWLSWILQDADKRPIKVVIAKKKAQARIDAALGGVISDPEMYQAEPLSKITEEEVEDMLLERQELRLARDFEAADKIRDYLLSHGVVISDKKLEVNDT